METNIIEPKVNRIPKKKIAIVFGVLMLAILILFLVKKIGEKPKYEQVSLVKTELYIDPPLEAQGKIVSQLPYTGYGFTVEYVPASGFYLFRLKGSNVDAVSLSRDKAIAWIQSHQGLEGDKFCGLKYELIYQYFLPLTDSDNVSQFSNNES